MKMKATPDPRLCARNVRWSLMIMVDFIVVVNLSELYR